jgi:hypothetical protein
MKTIVSIFAFCAVIESVLAGAAVRLGSQGAYQMMGGNNNAVRVGSEEAYDLVRGNSGGGRVESRETGSSGTGKNKKIFGSTEELKQYLKKEIEKLESEEKQRAEQAAAAYDKLADERIKKHVFDPSSSFKECVEKNGIQVVEAEDIKEAGTLAKKQASMDSNYIVKQIELSQALSTWQISTTPPYYLEDPARYDFEIYDYPSIKYKNIIIMKYPKEGISAKRNYKFITFSKKPTDKEIKFEEGEVIFVQKGLDLDVKMNQLRCVTMTGKIPDDVIKKVIKQHNKQLPDEVKEIMRKESEFTKK